MTHAAAATVLLAENSLFKAVGTIFQPIFKLFATILAFIYGVIPNYAIAITLLTILIMAILTPLTVKSTKSMIAMQRMQPEIKKLQAKYKGAENREQLNAELMRLYKEEGINPAGGCIPMLLQMPFLIVLYDVIRGITNTVTHGAHYTISNTNTVLTCHQAVCAAPRYLPPSSRMYHDLVAAHGAMYSFGMNLALKPFSHHSSWVAAIPYFVLVAVAVVLQFIQMRTMNARNPQAAQANPQMQTMQKIMPIFFAYIYFVIPAAVVIYMIVSTMIRIATQDVMFRMGIVQPVGAERSIPASSTVVEKKKGRGLLAAASAAMGRPVDDEPPGNPPGGAGAPGARGTPPPPSSGGKSRPPTTNGPSTRPMANGNSNGNGKSSNGSEKSRNGGAAGKRNGSDGATGTPVPPQAKPHPRSKAKRARKAR